MRKLGAVLLAAGCSSRFGGDNKLIAEIDGRPMVRAVADVLLGADCIDEVLVVTGHDVAAVERVLEGLPVRFAFNSDWRNGMGGSIALGVSKLNPALDGVAIVPGDMPRLTSSAIETLGAALQGSGRPLVVTSGTGVLHPGRPVTEDDRHDPSTPGHPRRENESVAIGLAARGVRSSIVRPSPSVHGKGDHGFVARLIDIAREKGASGYIGDGANRWAAVHRLDTAHLYCLALGQAPAGSVYHAVGEEGVATRDIAEVIARHLDLPLVSIDPEDAGDHFGWLGAFFGWDAPASNALTRQRLGWEPTHQGLIADLEEGFYFEPVGQAA